MVYNTITLTSQDVHKQEPKRLFSPTNSTPMETIFLSNIDQAVTFPVETLYFYQAPSPNKSPSSTFGIAELVEKGVAEALLVPYYFMAGRLNFNHETNRLELLCNNEGVLFVSATSKLTLNDLGNLSLPNSSFHHLIHRPGLYKSLAEIAIFTIQVTRFKCGGFAIGFLTNHAILDGISASEMFHNLASICRGEGLKTQVINNDRTALKARTPPLIQYPHQEYIKLPKYPSVPTSFTSKNQTSPSPLVFQDQKYDHKLFTFSPKLLSSLKEKALIKCSTFEAIVAHIWRARTKAVFGESQSQSQSQRQRLSSVLFAVDVRSKISPPLPKGYSGNAVITAFATARVWELAEKPLGWIVEKVKEGRDRVGNDGYVRSVIDWLEVHGGVPATCEGNSFYLSAWWKLGFEELDFGFGKVVHGGPVVSGNGEFVLLLGDGNGGINVWMGLEKEKMNKFVAHVFDI